MFTGIINQIGTIENAEKQGDLRLSIACNWPAESLAIGESIAVNGACLTVTNKAPGSFTVSLSAETVSRTAPRWQPGMRVNLERALKMGDALDGHLVTGHIDGPATITEIIASGGSHILALTAPDALSRFIAEKGSVTLDGVSLTVNQVEGSRFWVNIIPHTWAATTLSERKAGDALNMEVDLIARYVSRLLQK
jgi:riboflavin synthase